MIRDDYEYLDNIKSRFGEDFVKQFSTKPLFVLSDVQSTSIFLDCAKNKTDFTKRKTIDGKTKLQYGNFDLQNYLPWHDFVFLFKSALRESFDDYKEIEEHNPNHTNLYGQFIFSDKNPILTLSFYFINGIYFCMEGDLQNEDTKALKFRCSMIDKNGQVINDSESITHFLSFEQNNDLLTTFMMYLDSVCNYLKQCDEYPVEVTPNRKKQKKRKGKKHQWKNSIGPKVIFLDELPKISNESKGGTHASPKPHKRRGHFKTLKHEKFKHHPLYMVDKGIYVKPVWVGPEQTEYEGNIYKLKRMEQIL